MDILNKTLSTDINNKLLHISRRVTTALQEVVREVVITFLIHIKMVTMVHHRVLLKHRALQVINTTRIIQHLTWDPQVVLKVVPPITTLSSGNHKASMALNIIMVRLSKRTSQVRYLLLLRTTILIMLHKASINHHNMAHSNLHHFNSLTDHLLNNHLTTVHPNNGKVHLRDNPNLTITIGVAVVVASTMAVAATKHLSWVPQSAWDLTTNAEITWLKRAMVSLLLSIPIRLPLLRFLSQPIKHTPHRTSLMEVMEDSVLTMILIHSTQALIGAEEMATLEVEVVAIISNFALATTIIVLSMAIHNLLQCIQGLQVQETMQRRIRRSAEQIPLA